MHDLHRLLLSSEVRELSDEVARLFEDLDRQAPPTGVRPVGHCTPALDVMETDATLEVALDLPGVQPESVRVLIKGSTLLVAGLKGSPYSTERPGASFHLVERGFGRFVRAVQIGPAFDGARARSVLQGGELRVVLPKIADRRGREIAVPVETS